MLNLPYCRRVYRTGHRFPRIWVFPKEAWAALREEIPWEALGASLVISMGMAFRWGFDTGGSFGVFIGLLLVAAQIARSARFATATRIVYQRGLLFPSRKEILLQAIGDARVEVPAEGEDFGDIIIDVPGGEHRLRAVQHPHQVLKRLLALQSALPNTGDRVQKTSRGSPTVTTDASEDSRE